MVVVCNALTFRSCKDRSGRVRGPFLQNSEEGRRQAVDLVKDDGEGLCGFLSIFLSAHASESHQRSDVRGFR